MNLRKKFEMASVGYLGTGGKLIREKNLKSKNLVSDFL
jgi:hypothetical protein